MSESLKLSDGANGNTKGLYLFRNEEEFITYFKIIICQVIE